ncbi:MAG: DUF3467 domain-containing protein [Bacteroidetes bacterium]|nr:MAG: DUF3467 domain-containing protein [Bacteroidota bacterium]
MADQQKPGNQLNIELPEDVAEGTYSNLAIIAHSNSEFVLDFLRLVPNVPKAKVKSRIILTPQHAKRLLKALADNVSKYENQYGPIIESDPNGGALPPLGFTPTAQA